ncbi:hypothetical protein MKEN_00034700 [Mycena kentingensis (nom. inval.)]|nr:hypothetical protein MKEN_00034700 [Mycena kentingensis (nom. inval.)]
MAFAAAPPLPDEIISEIISPVLRISDQDFDNAACYTSPFASFSESTSALLVVCKAWLRVATPLLYNTVVIRSKAQAAALQTALRGNTQLGAFIKKLRVEGGFGAPMRGILQLAQNITDLFLVVSVWSSDPTTGLCTGLASINPRRLIIRDTNETGPNKQNKELVKKVSECIKTRWSNLKSVHIPHPMGSLDLHEHERGMALYEAIKKSKTIEEIVAPAPYAFEETTAVAILRELVKCPSIKRILLTDYVPMQFAESPLSEMVQEESLKDLVVLEQSAYWQPPPPAAVSQPTNPLFVPLASASPVVQDQIWSRVLFFAMDNDLIDDIRAQDVKACAVRDRWIPDNILYAPLLRVCKRFEAVGRVHLHRHIRLFESESTMLLVDALRSNAKLPSAVRSLSLDAEAMFLRRHYDEDYDPYDVPSVPDAPAIAAVNDLLALLPNVKLIDGGISREFPPYPLSKDDTPCVGWEALETMGRVCATSLEGLFGIEIASAGSVRSPLIFEAFGALRSLEWSCETQFGFPAGVAWSPGSLALPNLECLLIGKFHVSFLAALATTSMPSLRRVYFLLDMTAAQSTACHDFLAVHQSKLTELRVSLGDKCQSSILDVCPDLPVLIYGDGDPDAHDDGSGLDDDRPRPTLPKVAIFKPSHPHSKLEKIVLRFFGYAAVELQPLLASIKPQHLPALRTVQIYGMTWPTTERNIAKHKLIPTVETLLKSNISTMDGKGVVWRARLKRRN